jgi:hypothetical protein
MFWTAFFIFLWKYYLNNIKNYHYIILIISYLPEISLKITFNAFCVDTNGCQCV